MNQKEGEKMSPGLKDIAARAGVDIGTVSHVLNRRPKAALLKPETRRRILQIADELGYCRNEMASSVATGHGNVLAFVTAEMGSVEYTGRIQSGVFDEACARGYSVSVYHLNGKNHSEIVHRILGWRTAGVIFHIPALDSASEVIEVLKKNAIPYGTANLGNPGGIGVTTDDYQGALDAVKYLAGLGHRKILFLSIPERNAQLNEYSFNRRNGYLDGMKRYLPDIRPDILEVCNSEPGSVVGIREKLRRSGPTAVFCLGDSFAMRVFQAADREGIAIPEELSVVGYGGLVMSEYAAVPMTTVIQDFEKIGALTARQVIDRLEKKEAGAPERNIRLPVKLLIRDSTRKIA